MSRVVLRLPTTVWHLVMRSPDALRPARDPGPSVEVTRAEVALGARNRRYYEAIGAAHHWADRLPWGEARWQAFAERPGLETWEVWAAGEPAGYAELETRGHVAMFGILPAMQGRGLGGHLLTCVVRRAWALGPTVVTLDTCELDDPHALANYRARGFAVARMAVEPRGRIAQA